MMPDTAVRHRRAAHAVPVREARPTTSWTGCASAGASSCTSPACVFREGEPATCFYVLLDGTLALSRLVGADDVEISRTSQRGVYAGAWSAYLGDRAPQTYAATMRVHEPSRFYVLAADDFTELMQRVVPDGVHLLEGLFFGNQRTQSTIGQRERLLALGSLSAGLTHELNNPAAAAVRATSSLRDRVAGMRHKLGDDRRRRVGPAPARDADRAAGARGRAGRQGARLSPLEAVRPRGRAVRLVRRARRARRLRDRARRSSQAGIDVDWLEQLDSVVDDEMLEGAVRWLNYTLETELLMNEIEDSTTRISTLVAAAKQYSQMDRAPYQVLDVHELLDSTLVMLSRKIGPSVDGGQGLRPVAARHPGLRRRAEPGVDEPDRQRAAGDGRRRAR